MNQNILKVLESIKPGVILVDEIEKAFAELAAEQADPDSDTAERELIARFAEEIEK